MVPSSVRLVWRRQSALLRRGHGTQLDLDVVDLGQATRSVDNGSCLFHLARRSWSSARWHMVHLAFLSACLATSTRPVCRVWLSAFRAARSGAMSRVRLGRLGNVSCCTSRTDLWNDELPVPGAHRVCIGSTTTLFSVSTYARAPKAARVSILVCACIESGSRAA